MAWDCNSTSSLGLAHVFDTEGQFLFKDMIFGLKHNFYLPVMEFLNTDD